MGEEGDGVGPPRPEYVRLIKIAVVAAIVVAAVAIALLLILQAIAQPRFAITEPGFANTDCGLSPEVAEPVPPQIYTYSFTLSNTGDADGFVQVGFFLDENLVGSDTYFVSQGTSVPKTANVVVNDCVSHTPDLRILEVSKA